MRNDYIFGGSSSNSDEELIYYEVDIVKVKKFKRFDFSLWERVDLVKVFYFLVGIDGFCVYIIVKGVFKKVNVL